VQPMQCGGSCRYTLGGHSHIAVCPRAVPGGLQRMVCFIMCTTMS
jgi:hypothetical protein